MITDICCRDYVVPIPKAGLWGSVNDLFEEEKECFFSCGDSSGVPLFPQFSLIIPDQDADRNDNG